MVILWKFRGAVEFINSLVLVVPPLTAALTLVNYADVIGLPPALLPPFCCAAEVKKKRVSNFLVLIKFSIDYGHLVPWQR